MITASTVKETHQEDGGKTITYFNAAGEYHRVGGPANIKYYENGQIAVEEFWVGGKLHREDGPSCVGYYAHGKLGYEDFHMHGEYHRVDGPARMWYYADGQVDFTQFWVDGKLHREDGPAWVYYREDGQVKSERFHLEGVELTPKEFLYKTYIDKLPSTVLREQATQLAEQGGWNITIEQLEAAIELTLEKKPVVKLGSAAKRSSVVDSRPGI